MRRLLNISAVLPASVVCMESGSHRSDPRTLVPENPASATPMTVTGWLLSRMVVPTMAGLASKRSSHKR
jgi:hypothetical protein